MVIKKKAVFLDRDGVLNKPKIIKGKSYAPLKVKDFKLYPNVKKLCKSLKNKKYLLIIVTNQPDIKKGKISVNDLNIMHKKLYKSINYDGIYYCTAISKSSRFKKPNVGMFKKAIKEHKIDLSKSYMIGDRYSDIEAAKKIKCKSIFINRKYKEKMPNTQLINVKSFSQAAKFILNA